jgi:hypothetical protein
MIMVVKMPDEEEQKYFNAIFLCSTKDPMYLLEMMEELDLGEIIHEEGEPGIDMHDPFRLKKIFFN